jgi:hypothetical protein
MVTLDLTRNPLFDRLESVRDGSDDIHAAVENVCASGLSDVVER